LFAFCLPEQQGTDLQADVVGSTTTFAGKFWRRDRQQYADEELKQIADLLWSLAQLSVEHFLNQINYDLDEMCNSDGMGKFG
jgi:hypothetical protein